MYDVVLFGPTGVTGREVARHLGRRAAATGRSWAVAGRDRGRIEAVLSELGVEPAAVLVADTSDPASIDAMVGSARVVANLVGPYADHGEVVYAACIRHGTVELDLTGELDWLVAMVDRHQAAAVASGARLVPMAGFEALPFDLAARLAAEAAHERWDEAVVGVDVAVATRNQGRVRRPADALSGGTWASAVGIIRRGAGGGATGPYALDPPGGPSRPTQHELRPRRHPATGAWLAPMVPSPLLNPPVAHRTAALLRAAGDPTFDPTYRYREGIAVSGPVAPVLAGSLVGAQLGLAGLGRAPGPLRRVAAHVLDRVGPSPGDGPREEDLDRWSYRLDVRATTSGGGTADVVVEALGHPGYKSTATMVGEAALVLADPEAPVPAGAGFLTPATALGLSVLDRFVEAGVTFHLEP